MYVYIYMHICNVGPMAYVTRIKFVIVIVIYMYKFPTSVEETND